MISAGAVAGLIAPSLSQSVSPACIEIYGTSTGSTTTSDQHKGIDQNVMSPTTRVHN